MTSIVVLATRNPHKLDELRRILQVHGVSVDLRSVADFDGIAEVVETESTFAGNALLKARAISSATGLPAVADDSGLCVDALNQMPGVLSARWAGGHGDDAANLRLVLDQLRDTPDHRRGAAFRCAAAVVLADGTERVVEGSVDGRLLREPRGHGGFGYDPIFVPTGLDRSFAEIPGPQKDAMSHRGQALERLAPILGELVD